MNTVSVVEDFVSYGDRSKSAFLHYFMWGILLSGLFRYQKFKNACAAVT